jgi:predicted lipid-binding transport protein (Tim44 family)
LAHPAGADSQNSVVAVVKQNRDPSKKRNEHAAARTATSTTLMGTLMGILMGTLMGTLTGTPMGSLMGTLVTTPMATQTNVWYVLVAERSVSSIRDVKRGSFSHPWESRVFVGHVAVKR